MIKGLFREFIQAPSSLKMSVQLTPQRYFYPISHQHPLSQSWVDFQAMTPKLRLKAL